MVNLILYLNICFVNNILMNKIISKNPFTRTINKQFVEATRAELDKAILRAAQAFKIQVKRTPQQKVTLMEKLAQNLEKNNDKLARLISIQMGKPIKQSKEQVALVQKHARTYAREMDTFLAPTIVHSESKKKAVIKYAPLGVLYCIVPFNYPFYLTFKGGLGNLVLGNCLLVRPCPLTPMMAELTQQIMEQSGFNNGQFQQVFTARDDLNYILGHKDIVGVHFTGSSKTGAIIAQAAGKNIKKSVMELGGNDPFIVLEDAIIDDAVKTAVLSRSANCGQVCFSPKRFIIVGNYAYDLFKTKLTEKLKALKFGDPTDPTTEIGPLASEEAHKGLLKQLKQIPSSWKLHFKSDVKEPFFPIHIFQATSTQPYNQEFFGPIFNLYKAKDEKDAIEIANQGEYGLGATCFSRDSNRAEKVLDQIRAGMTFVNAAPRAGTHLPNGGVGKSGYGRECGMEGFREFSNVKLYYVN